MTGFAEPALKRLWRVAHERRERRGVAGDARIVLRDLTAEEAFALDGLPWPGRVQTVLAGATFTTTLSRIEATITAAGGDPEAVLIDAVGTAPRDLPGESHAHRDRRIAFGAWLGEHRLVRVSPGLGDWAAHVGRVGTPGPGDRALVTTALDIVAALPRSPPVALSTLAAQLLDADAHGLDRDRPLGRLVTTILSWRAGHADRRLDPIETRELWLGDGIEIDPLSCTALTLGLAPDGDAPLPRALRALHGQAVVLTYGQLRAAQRLHCGRQATVFTCENPVVVRAAELALGASCPPLICTGGWPNAAVLTLLDDLHAAGATIHHHGDADPAGVMILDHLAARLEAAPWRLDASKSAPTHDENAPHPRPAAGPEELDLDALLQHLESAGRG
jgi:uncharacterized protein (TIGR02679 family)